jgi:hypothetical protein
MTSSEVEMKAAAAATGPGAFNESERWVHIEKLTTSRHTEDLSDRYLGEPPNGVKIFLTDTPTATDDVELILIGTGRGDSAQARVYSEMRKKQLDTWLMGQDDTTKNTRANSLVVSFPEHQNLGLGQIAIFDMSIVSFDTLLRVCEDRVNRSISGVKPASQIRVGDGILQDRVYKIAKELAGEADREFTIGHKSPNMQQKLDLSISEATASAPQAAANDGRTSAAGEFLVTEGLAKINTINQKAAYSLLSVS